MSVSNVGVADVLVTHRVVAGKFGDLLEGGECLSAVTILKVRGAEGVVVHPEIGIGSNRALVSGDCLLGLTCGAVGVSQAAIGFIGVGSKSEGPFQLDDSLSIPSGSRIHSSKGEKHFRSGIGKSLGLLGGKNCFLRPNTVFGFAVIVETGIRQSRIGEGKIGILVDGLFEERNGLRDAGGVVTVAKDVASLQVEVIRFEVLRGMSAGAGKFFVARF